MGQPATATAIEFCSWKGCNKPATNQFRWEWGETGVCCEACVPLLHQTAGQLSRTVAISALGNASAPPLERAERTLLIASKLSAEGETAEVRQRAEQLYRDNVRLSGQVQTLTLQKRELESKVELNEQRLAPLQVELSEREAECASLHEEVERLSTLLKFQPEQADELRRDLGLQGPADAPPAGPSVVEGAAPTPDKGKGKGKG